MEEELIKFVRDNPFLYNKKNKNYKNARLRDQKYNELGKKLNVPAQKLKDRWRTLRDKFVKDYKRKPTGSGWKSPRKWKWMDDLSFLKDIDYENTKTTENVVKMEFTEDSLGSTTEEFQTIYSDTFEHDLLEFSSTPSSLQRTLSTSESKTTKPNKIDDMLMEAKTDFHEVVQLVKDVLREPNPPVKSSIQLFCDGLASQIEEANLSQFQLSGLQIALLQTFQEFLPKGQ